MGLQGSDIGGWTAGILAYGFGIKAVMGSSLGGFCPTCIEADCALKFQDLGMDCGVLLVGCC